MMRDFYFEPMAETWLFPLVSRSHSRSTNQGLAVHNLTSTDFGGSSRTTFKRSQPVRSRVDLGAGTYKFICTYHPGMDVRGHRQIATKEGRVSN